MGNPFGRMAYASAPSGTTAASNNGATSSGSGLVDFTAASGNLSDVMAGRISLSMVAVLILAMTGFYVWTRNAQGGG